MFASRDARRRFEREKSRRLRQTRSRRQKPVIEELEKLTLLAVVTNTNDGGAGSLTQAIMDVNAGLTNTIDFNIPGPGVNGLQIIKTAGLPSITAQVAINGFSQNPQSQTPPIELTSNGAPGAGLTLAAGSDGSTVTGLYITGFASVSGILINSGGNTIGGNNATGPDNVISGNGGSGITITGTAASRNTVIGNYIGTDLMGTTALPNVGDGIDISGGATGNTIGGLTSSARNIVSGNNANSKSDGVDIFNSGTSGNVVEGNYIGVDVSGIKSLGNGESGVYIYLGATSNTIGGVAAGALNVISGNAADGIDIHDSGTTGNIIQGNYIGLDSTGSKAAGNGLDGIDIDRAGMNTVGGTTTASRNVISGNGVVGATDPGDGVEIVDPGATGNLVEGNYIGVAFDGTAAVGNAGSGVNIFSGATTNTIGGAGSAANLILGNTGDGVAIHDAGTTGNTVVGNIMGLDTNGAVDPNRGAAGVEIYGGATSNIIGGAGALGNLISGNIGDGVSIHDAGTNTNSVLGNTIGLNTAGGGAGSKAQPNSGFAGIEIFNGAASNTIGTGAAGNLIAGNSGDGIDIHGTNTDSNIVLGDTIGLNTLGGGADRRPSPTAARGLKSPRARLQTRLARVHLAISSPETPATVSRSTMPIPTRTCSEVTRSD